MKRNGDSITSPESKRPTGNVFAILEEEDLRDKLERGAIDAGVQDESTGESLLMRAAGRGEKGLVELLLEHAAPWNAIDRNGKCAGEYAIDAGKFDIVEILVNAGVRAEMILGTLLQKRKIKRGPASNEEYLKSSVEYTNDEQKLMDPQGDAVMMEWETPLMQLHAKLICSGSLGDDVVPSSDRSVLNIGFGMGIIDACIEAYGCKNHTIIEAHPQVYQKMLDDGWDKKPGVNIVFGRWQDVISGLGKFDGIFFDTYGEYYEDMQELHQVLKDHMTSGGVYSFFNGLCPRNIFFHGVACQVSSFVPKLLHLIQKFCRLWNWSSPI